MPSIDRIKQFNTILKSLSREPEILAEKGEEIEDVELEAGPLDATLQELLDAPDSAAPEYEGDKLDLTDVFAEGKPIPDHEEHVDHLPEEFQEETPAEDLFDIPDISLDDADEKTPASTAAGEGLLDNFDIPDINFDDAPVPDTTPPDHVADSVEEQFNFDDIAGGALPDEADEILGETTDETTGDSFELPDTEEPSPDQPTTPSPEETFSIPEMEEPLGDIGVSTAGDFKDESPQDIDFSFEELSPDTLFEPAEKGPTAAAEETADLGLPDAEDISFSEETPPIPDETFDVQDYSSEAPGAPDDFELPDWGSVEEKTPKAGLNLDLDSSDSGLKDDNFMIDEFTMPETAESAEVAFDSGIPELISESRESIKPKTPGADLPQGDEEEREFSEQDFKSIQDTLNSLPLNLKVEIENLIGVQKITGQRLNKLIDQLIGGYSVKEIAEHVSKITGKKIRIPKKFQKKSGEAFEAERKSFAYAFKQNFFPIVRVLVPSLVAVVLLIMAIIELVIIPNEARTRYELGLKAINIGNSEEAENFFNAGLNIKFMREYYFKYADSYLKLVVPMPMAARHKYEQLLERIPGDKDGLWAWAALETSQGYYQTAQEKLNQILTQDKYNYQGLLATGDNYLKWALSTPEGATTEREALFKESIAAYDKLEYQHGPKNNYEPRFRQLNYYMITDNEKMVTKYRNFFESNPSIKINPFLYTEMAGYYLNKEQIQGIENILLRAYKRDKSMPETYYQYSRFYEKVFNEQDREETLKEALRLFNQLPSLREDQWHKKINTYNWLGEIYYARGDTATALNDYFLSATRAIEDNKDSLKPTPDYGRVYANKGEFYYFNKNFSQAQTDFATAEQYGYKTPDLDYKIGVIDYAQEDYDAAIARFYRLSERFPENPNILYSLANAHFKQYQLPLAQTNYLLLVEGLEERYRQIVDRIRPGENPAHTQLLNMLIVAHNNLGITLQRLGENPLDPRKTARAQIEFLKSSEYYDLRSRDRATMIRPITKPYGYINREKFLKPDLPVDYLFYNDLPLYLTGTDWPVE